MNKYNNYLQRNTNLYRIPYNRDSKIFKEKFPADHSELQKAAMAKLKENNVHKPLTKTLPKVYYYDYWKG